VTSYVAVGWFPAAQLEKARVLWPDLLGGWEVVSSYQDYCRAVDRHLRQLDLPGDTQVLLAPIEVKHFVKWCAQHGADPAAPASRAGYAKEVATRGRVQEWPPAPDRPCWCGGDKMYGACCGA
jgi:hypothetical protein